MNEKTGVRIVFLATVVVAAGVIGLMMSMYTARPRGHLTQPIPEAAHTADQAAIEIFTYVYKTSHYYEYGGVILKWPGGSFMGANPDTDYDGVSVHFDEDDGDFPGGKIVADYHTHPCLEAAYTYAFSPQDIFNMRLNSRPGYVLDECTGDIHYWEPGDPTDKPKFGISGVLATGRIIGHIKVDGIRLR